MANGIIGCRYPKHTQNKIKGERNVRQQIGCIIFYISIALGFLALLAPQIYWFVKCYTEGGDWKYYGKNILIGVWLAMLTLALLLVLS